MYQPKLSGWEATYEFLHALATSPSPLYKALVTSDEESYLAWVLACIVPFTHAPGQDLSANLKKTPPAATLAAREGIKAPGKISELISAAVKHREEIFGLKDMVCGGDERMHERDRFGMAVRRWEAQGKHWRLQVLFAVLDDVMTRAQSGSGGNQSGEAEKDWRVFVQHLAGLELMEAPSIKPLMDGRKLSQALGVKPGKWMASALDVCMAWQLRNPKETDPSGAVEEVRRRKKELGIA